MFYFSPKHTLVSQISAIIIYVCLSNCAMFSFNMEMEGEELMSQIMKKLVLLNTELVNMTNHITITLTIYITFNDHQLNYVTNLTRYIFKV